VLYPFLQVNGEFIAGGHPAIVFQRFGSGWFNIIAYERNTAYFQFFRSGKKGHIYGIIVQGINQAALFQYAIVQAGFFCFQGTGQTDWAAANDYNVELIG
jgi:hypothetical protein